MNAPRPIDLAFAEINALGGHIDPANEIDVEVAAILTRVLDILETHGARDVPLMPTSSFAEHQAGFISCGGF